MSDESQRMQMMCSVTEAGDLKLDYYCGPLMASAILDVSDEEPVITMLRKGFEDLRRYKAGETLEEIAQSRGSDAPVTV